MKKHKKGVLPSGWYHGTLRAFQDNGLVWVIDQEGDYAWRTIIDDSELDDARLWRICSTLNRDDLDIGVRAKIHLAVQLKGNFRKNVVLEYTLPDEPAHFDVTKEKSDDHFYQTENKPNLPI